ncbi:alkaline phosphatase [Leptolyngbya sp. NK1-12]|uniref:alkaline phosphatase n=1 Tax=Leptolyngbya sp. NK1-12 TaxID=2547451 RepID=UPI00292DDB63
MARAAAIAKQIDAGHNGMTLGDFYTSGKGAGLSFQELENYTNATTYSAIVAGDTDNSALEGIPDDRGTGEAPVRTGFAFNPSFNAEGNPAGGNLVGYDPVQGGPNPWTPGTNPDYIEQNYVDSSAAGTALFSGVKTFNGGLGVDLYEQPIETVLETAQAEGKAVGVVSTVPISHATPAAPAAHVNNRNDYDDDYPENDTILQQMLLQTQPDLILGGGHPLDLNNETDTSGEFTYQFIAESTYRHLVDNPTGNRYGYTFLERGPDAGETLLQTATELNPEDGDRLFGLYGARGQNGNLPLRTANSDYSNTGLDTFSHRSSQRAGELPDTIRPLAEGETVDEFIQRELNENPSFLEMTQASLDFLSKDEDGFFLMVEQGDMDWVLHDNNMENLLGTVFDLDDAVEYTIDWIEANGGWEENLLIVTADHDHYLTLNDNFPALYRQYGAEALTLAFDPNLAGHYFGSNPEDKYEWGNHSNRPVPVFYQGAGSEVLTGYIGAGFENYGVEVPGIPDHVDLVHLAETMRAGVTASGEGEKATSGDDTLLATGNAVLFGGAGNDTLVSTGAGNNRLYGAEGDDILFGGADDTLLGGVGDDAMYALGTGETTMVGGAGVDQFWIANGELPETSNIVIDFEVGVDVIGLAGVSGVSSIDDLSFTQGEMGAVISAMGQNIAVLNSINVIDIGSNSFAFA